MRLNRRTFIKIGGVAAGAAAVGIPLAVHERSGHARELALDPGTDGDEIVPTFCEMCFWKCGVLAHVRQGRVTKIVGNPEHPLSRGRLCPRGTGGTGLLYDPDRLKKPLIRRDKRGDAGVRGGELGHGARPHRRAAHQHQEEVRPRGARRLHARLRRVAGSTSSRPPTARATRARRATRSAAARAMSRGSSPTAAPSVRPRSSTSRTRACSR